MIADIFCFIELSYNHSMGYLQKNRFTHKKSFHYIPLQKTMQRASISNAAGVEKLFWLFRCEAFFVRNLTETIYRLLLNGVGYQDVWMLAYKQTDRQVR